jgi:tetratricopeptide (TPR) repeat protein
MSDPVAGAIESDTPLFDVVINVPPGASLEEIEHLARDVAGIASDKVDRLIQVLRSSPQAKIGAAVTREKADLAQAQFSKAGLLVTITPLLTIQTATANNHDGSYSCPACQKRVILPENRQCPACGIFVDKVTDEFLLRRKMMEQERGKIEYQQAKSAKDSDKRSREMMEAAMRAKVREELEKEYGIKKKKGLFEGSSGLFRGIGLVGLLAVAFFGGRGFSLEGLPGSKSAADKKEAGAAQTMSADSLEKAAQGTSGEAGEAGTVATASGDPDLDDPLIQAAAGKPGGKTLTLEQALAASKTLAKSVGNTTADRAMAGGSVGGKAGSASQAANDAIDSAIDNPSSSAVADGRASSAGGAGSGGSANSAAGGTSASGVSFSGGAGAASVAVPKQTKLVLTAEFARILAELGQSARAREVLKAATASLNPAAEPEAAAALKNAELRAQAWALQRRESGAPGKAAEDLKNKILALPNPVERTQLLGQVAVILSRGGQLPPEVPRIFLSLAADSLKSITGAGQPNAALGDLAVSMAEVFSNETSARAKAGQWSKAQASAGQIDALIKQAPDPWAQLRLYAIDHQIKQQLGQSDKAKQSLDAALAQASKNPNLSERAIWLRSVAQLADAAAQEQMDAMTSSLQAQLETKSGLEKAQALTQLALLYANGGLPAKADQYRRMAQATAGLSPAENTVISTELIVRSDLAMARVLQSLGRYAEAESMLQRVGGYLF